MIESRSLNTVQSDGLVIVAAALMGIGLVAVASASASLDHPLFGSGFFTTTLGRQFTFLAVGFGILLLTRRLTVTALQTSWIRLWAPRILFALTIAGLAAALIPGLSIVHGGAHRWLRLGYGGVEVGAQPSELSKVAIVLLLGSLLGRSGADPRSFRRCFLPVSAVIAATVLLVGCEDFGTSVLIGCVGVSMMFVAGCRLQHLAVLAVLGVIVLAVLVLSEDYRMDRLTSFLGGYDNSHDLGYQPKQSLATLASGGWAGTGLGLGTQKYGYLPASRTDFVFSIICEETGALGGMLVIGLFGVLVWLGMRTMWAANSPYGRLIAFGLTAIVGLQAAMNLAVATVVVPTTGISLPLISAGGSGVLTFCFAIGILAGVSRYGDRQDVVESRDAITFGVASRA